MSVRLLLDTHVLLWYAAGDAALPRRVRALLDDPAHDIVASAGSAWEVATKHRLGKLPGAGPFAADFEGTAASLGFASLPITGRHAQLAGALPQLHRDPFDRVLAAQALLEQRQLVSGDAALDAFGVGRVW